MPPTRPRTTLTGAALAAGLLLGVLAPPGTAGTTTEERTVTIKAVEPRDDVFVVKGRVRPKYADRRVVVQRKLRRDDEWSRWRRTSTGDKSWYRERVKQLKRPGVVCYRVRIPPSNDYPEALSERICIRTFWK